MMNSLKNKNYKSHNINFKKISRLKISKKLKNKNFKSLKKTLLLNCSNKSKP